MPREGILARGGEDYSVGKLLLLYDTDDKDFARDVFDFIEGLDVEVVMIPRAPDGGVTLQGKEEAFFDGVDAAVFLITPGSERHGKKMPSPSVADEMGQAKVKFKNEPWRVIYLADSECTIQAVDQRAYIGFERTNHRSMVEAMTRLVAALKDAGVLAGQLPSSPSAPPQIDVGAVVSSLSGEHVALLLHLSRQPSGQMFFHDFVKAASQHLLSGTDGNLTVRDLLGRGLVAFGQGIPNIGGTATAYLTSVGWEAVRVLRARERASAEAAATLKRKEPPGGYAKIVG